MNKVILMGRLTRDPEIRYTQAAEPLAMARWTLAVDRRIKSSSPDEKNADFIPCLAFGKQAEFAEKYFRQGIKIVVSGRIQTGSYVNRNGIKVYTTEVVIEELDFAESKRKSDSLQDNGAAPDAGFTNIPEGLEDRLPFE